MKKNFSDLDYSIDISIRKAPIVGTLGSEREHGDLHSEANSRREGEFDLQTLALRQIIEVVDF